MQSSLHMRCEKSKYKIAAPESGVTDGDAHDHLGVVNAVGAASGVKQPGRSADVVTGSSVGVDGATLGAFLTLNLVSHSKELPFKS